MREFVLQTADGVLLPARHHPASGVSRSAVVLVHGFSASKDHPEVVEVAEALAEVGHEVVTYDSRGHRSSGGLCTLGDAERLDVAAAVAEARRLSGTVVALGASMGAIAVLRHAADDSDLAGVVTVSAPDLWRVPRNLRTALSTLLTRTKLGRAVAARRLGVRIHPVWSNPPPPVELVRRIDVPLAVIHGDADRMIPASAARRLVESAGGPSRLSVVAGMRHAFDPVGVPAILEAVDWALGYAPARPSQP